jgi:hypothetical protein
LIGLEIRGGDTLLRLYDAANVWIDRCHIHDGTGCGISANAAANTDHLYLTRNQIHHTGGTAEGMYLGANDGTCGDARLDRRAQSTSTTPAGSQGDGIEVKQGSFNNWIVENHVHDCQYPCILVYGTGGEAPNVIERNVCYRSGDNVMQVQGEAIVRNNLLIQGANGFASHDHQGQSKDLTFVHNTILNTGRGAHLASWGGRPNMVFANNVVYSQSGDAVRFGNGSAGVQIAGNVALGSISGASSGFSQGTGLADFAHVAWDGSARNAHPTGGGHPDRQRNLSWAVFEDLAGILRSLPLDSGCYDGR